MKSINVDKVIKTLRERKNNFCRNQIEFSMLSPDQKARMETKCCGEDDAKD